MECCGGLHDQSADERCCCAVALAYAVLLRLSEAFSVTVYDIAVDPGEREDIVRDHRRDLFLVHAAGLHRVGKGPAALRIEFRPPLFQSR